MSIEYKGQHQCDAHQPDGDTTFLAFWATGLAASAFDEAKSAIMALQRVNRVSIEHMNNQSYVVVEANSRGIENTELDEHLSRIIRNVKQVVDARVSGTTQLLFSHAEPPQVSPPPYKRPQPQKTTTVRRSPVRR